MVKLCGLPIEQKTLDGWGTVSSLVGRRSRWTTDKLRRNRKGRDGGSKKPSRSGWLFDLAITATGLTELLLGVAHPIHYGLPGRFPLVGGRLVAVTLTGCPYLSASLYFSEQPVTSLAPSI